jgi:hypothetical protein
MKRIPFKTLLELRALLAPCQRIPGLTPDQFDTLLNVSRAIGVLEYWIDASSEGIELEVTHEKTHQD